MEENNGLSQPHSSKHNFSDYSFLAWFLAIWLIWKLWIKLVGVESVPITARTIPALSRVWETINEGLRQVLLAATQSLLHVFGYGALIRSPYIWIKNYEYAGSMAVGNYCLGFQLMFYHTALTLISKVSPLKKAAYILLGLFAIQALNVLRLAGLMLVKIYSPAQLWLAHDYVFVIPVLALLLYFYYRTNRNVHAHEING
ncbi:MAG: exosortase/archaeosortase family protein [Chitinophagales bacterium]